MGFSSLIKFLEPVLPTQQTEYTIPFCFQQNRFQLCSLSQEEYKCTEDRETEAR